MVSEFQVTHNCAIFPNCGEDSCHNLQIYIPVYDKGTHIGLNNNDYICIDIDVCFVFVI